MNKRLIALLAALVLPSLAWAGSRYVAACPLGIPCDHCPLAKR
jgi:hypothetical protein